MLIRHISEFKNGWVVGDFNPAIWNNKDIEVAFHKHKIGDDLQSHFHIYSSEITVVVHGQIEVNGRNFEEGDIFIIEPYEVSIARVITDCKLIVIKSPSVPSDKVIIELKL